MKKLFLFAVIAVAVVSCGPKKTEQATVNQDSIVTVDTVKTDSVKVDSAVVKTDTAVVKK
ncbi:conserved exported hypothetical protein [uncultured Paludibacter sp.]|nr:conserved exported hypothetical protein [uncultured Paludibacter sp.]